MVQRSYPVGQAPRRFGAVRKWFISNWISAIGSSDWLKRDFPLRIVVVHVFFDFFTREVSLRVSVWVEVLFSLECFLCRHEFLGGARSDAFSADRREFVPRAMAFCSEKSMKPTKKTKSVETY